MDGFIWVEEGQVNVTALNSGQTVSLFEKMYAEVDEGGSSVESAHLVTISFKIGEGYEDLEEDLIERTVIVRFRDANGQVREIPLTIFENLTNNVFLGSKRVITSHVYMASL